MKIIYSPKFQKSYKKLPKGVKLRTEEKEEIFRIDTFDARLKTHRLKGQLSDHYTISVSYHYRIVFHFEKKDVVILDAVGTHAVYR